MSGAVFAQMIGQLIASVGFHCPCGADDFVMLLEGAIQPGAGARNVDMV